MTNFNLDKYDVALSFAGEDREYVDKVANLLKNNGIKVFYDRFEEANLWGKDLYSYLNDIYKNKSNYTIMFVSEHYSKKLWTNHERQAMQAKAFEENKEYILPVRFDDSEIIGLNKTTGYIDLRNKTPEAFTDIILKKLDWKNDLHWWGDWSNNVDLYIPFSQKLVIDKVTDNGFHFKITMYNGAHLGEIEGEAIIRSENYAVFEHKCNEEDICILTFYRTLDSIQIQEANCHYFHGARGFFNGDYTLQKSVFHSRIKLNDLQLSRLYSLLKCSDNFKYFASCFSDTHFIDGNYGYDIISGGVPGLYTIAEAIIVYSRKSNNICGAYIRDSIVYRFNDVNQPYFIDTVVNQWKEQFNDYEVKYI